MTMNDLDLRCINTIRFLAVDAVEQANSGHPGMPLGAAPLAYVLYTRIMRYNPRDPKWFDRDRFILSAGHASAMLYAVLHLTGYDLSLEDLMNFRQWESKTPGHPEYGHTPGVEATTGPLGQGFCNGVGMAMAEKFLAKCHNTDTHTVVDHYTYAICSDGDLMEGITSEAASLAGHLGLGKLIYLYDDNKISIEGSTELTFTEDVGKRFEAYNWQVLRVDDANDLDALESAIREAQDDTARPSLIICRSDIGFGSPRQGNAKAHGEPLGAEAMAATRSTLCWPEKNFCLPEDCVDYFRTAIDRGAQCQSEWEERVAGLAAADSEAASAFKAAINNELPAGWEDAVPVFSADDKPVATRNASGKVLNAIAAAVPNIIGGSADLAPSNKTWLDDEDVFTPQHAGRNIHFGVREHVMGAIVNGMALHGGVIPYGGTFLIFSDYMRPAVRLAALMNIRSIFVWTHDSIGVGEDGPTHQPIEQTMSLRLIPNFTMLRPADANETAAAWKIALTSEGPVGLALTRQNLPILDAQKTDIFAGVTRGAYIIRDAGEQPDVMLLATGSEVALSLEAAEVLAGKGIAARVVSMPSWELFEKQSDEYKASVLPCCVPRVAVEAGSTLGWWKYVGGNGEIIGLDRFGASAPGDEAMEKLGFNVENVVAAAERVVAGAGK